MNEAENISNLIERFLNNELSGKELSKFEQKMANDPDFAQEVALERVIQQAVVNDGLQEWQQALKKESRLLKRKRSWKGKAGFALIVLFLISGTWLMYRGIELDYEEENIPFSQIAEITDSIKNNTVEEVTIEERTLEKLMEETKEVDIPTVKEERTDTNRSEINYDITKDQVVIVESTTISENKEKVETEMDRCEGVFISAKLSIVSTCEGENEGLIMVKSVQGGTKPYQYQLDGVTPWQTRNSFDHLAPSTYTLVVKDKNGCQSVIDQPALVEEKYCYKPEAGFNPDYETWEFHLEDEIEFNITLVNKRGQEIYSQNVDGAFEWDGRDAEGNKVASGLYKYIVISKGKKKLGTVTVIY